MPKQTPNLAQQMASAPEPIVTDARGRKIKLRKPNIVSQYNFIDMLGESARNQMFVGMAMPLLFVCEIDAVAVPSPRKRSEFDALLARLDEDGVAAVMRGVEEHFAGKDEEAQKEAVKN